jgi:DNA repair protein RadD
MLTKQQIQFRDYQEEAISSVIEEIYELNNKDALIEAPTGSGKTYKMVGLSEKILTPNPTSNVLILSPQKELIKQTYESMLDFFPEKLIGVYSAGLLKKERKKITVVSIHSVYKKSSLFRMFDNVLIDETHLIPPKGEGKYRTFLNGLEDPNIIGLTATPFRLGHGYIYGQKESLFRKITYKIRVEELIKKGHLSPLTTKDAENVLDTSDVHTLGGDFKTSEMSEQFDKFTVTKEIVEELVTYKNKYKHWLLFAINIEHAEHIVELLQVNGIKAQTVHSKQKAELNDKHIGQYKTGQIQCLVSVASLTTGFDAPLTDLIGLIRPTKSPVLHIQMIGRGLRKSEETGKTHCLILDFAGNITRLGPINDVHVPIKGKQKGVAPVKTCPKCRTHIPASATICYKCGHEFPRKESSDLSADAETKEVVKTNFQPKKMWVDVSNISYTKHVTGFGESIKVSYTCGLRVITEYIAIGRAGKSGYNASYWWAYRSKFKDHPDFYSPPDVNDALKRIDKELKIPTRIFIDDTSKYPKILRSTF